MPKRTDIKCILIIGAGPIVIGQACEFDYSGVQACKALKEEGYRVILVNSNPATIMTDPGLADATYIEPITPDMVAKIIETRAARRPAADHGRPDRAQHGDGAASRRPCSRSYGVELIGANAEAIDKAEDRLLFREAMTEIGLECPKSEVVHNREEARERARPCRPARHHPPVLHPGRHRRRHRLQPRRIFRASSPGGIDASPVGEVLIEESVLGWKEYEMEVVRDRADNCIIICSIENVDPMGVHTGDSRHRRAGADADRQGIPDHARRLDRVPARDRRRYRRLERAVRGQPRDRPHGGDRDEPARLALLGAGLEGDRLPDRQDRGASWRSATRSTSCRTTSPARRRPRSSRRSTTSSPRCRASPSRNSPAPRRCSPPR